MKDKKEQRKLLCEIIKEDEKDGLYDINPSHYKSDNDVIQFCLDNNIGFCEGNVIKYVRRWKDKGGVEDLFKAREYIDRLIKNNE